jgi:hypothetical protein
MGRLPLGVGLDECEVLLKVLLVAIKADRLVAEPSTDKNITPEG